MHAHNARNLTPAKSAVVDSIGYNVIVTLDRAVAESLDRHFHIALSGTNPNISGKDIEDSSSFVAIVDSDSQWSETGCRGLNADEEPAVLVGCGMELICSPACGNGHVGLCLCPSPKVGFGVLLDNHSVGKNMWQAYFCLNTDCSQCCGRKY